MFTTTECPKCGEEIEVELSAEMDCGDIVFNIENNPMCSKCGYVPEEMNIDVVVTTS